MQRARRGAFAALLALVSALGFVFAFPTIARADPSCRVDGAYILFARGTIAGFNSGEALEFRNRVTTQAQSFSLNTEWAELGNLDGNFSVSGSEYPAAPFVGGSIPYDTSVDRGARELVTHLNDRYKGDGPEGTGSCAHEVVILGGYSQGAQVVGQALNDPLLSKRALDHIGAVGLYGDTKYKCDNAKWSAIQCSSTDHGIFAPREPYVRDELLGVVMSWCDSGDGFCSGYYDQGNHGEIYETTHIRGSSRWLALRALLRLGDLGIGNYPKISLRLYYLEELRYIAVPSTPPPLPVVKSVKRRTDHVGTYQLYAATKSAVTEAWWRPGEEVRAKEMIHISQDNIVGFDKVNEPDGTTQSLYTAVPDGVWETWWRPGDGPHHNKIITGLSGVRQVIADPVWEGGQYTHRLYILAQDGPYEAWWREGGDGIHLKRLDIVNDPVTMEKSKGPDGTDQLYVATPTWVFELWWRHDTAVNHGPVINITQGDIRSLDKGANQPDGGQLLYTGTSTTAWQTHWNSANGTGISHGTITVGQTNAGQIEKTVYDGVHQLYQTNGCRVQENWWNGPSSGSSTLINISQCNITSFDKSADGPDQQVYTASGDLVYETWWRGGSNASGPNTSVLFKVAR